MFTPILGKISNLTDNFSKRLKPPTIVTSWVIVVHHVQWTTIFTDSGFMQPFFLDGGMLRTGWMLANVWKAIRAWFFHWLEKGLKHTKCYYSGMIIYEIYEIPVCSRQSALHGICLAVLSVLFLSATCFFGPSKNAENTTRSPSGVRGTFDCLPGETSVFQERQRTVTNRPLGKTLWRAPLPSLQVIFFCSLWILLGTSLKKHKKKIVIR